MRSGFARLRFRPGREGAGGAQAERARGEKFRSRWAMPPAAASRTHHWLPPDAHEPTTDADETLLRLWHTPLRAHQAGSPHAALVCAHTQ